MIRIYLLLLLYSSSSLLYGHALRLDRSSGRPADEHEVAVMWATMTLSVIKNAPSNTPTYSSRSLAYMGIAMYESVFRMDPKRRSLAGQLNGLAALPQPEIGKAYNWPLVLNASQALLLYRLYVHASPAIIRRIDSLQRSVTTKYATPQTPEVDERSMQYGWLLANALFDWSKTDGGHEGYNNIFKQDYTLPIGKSFWLPPTKGQSAARLPLHSNWGNNRTFVLANSRLPVPAALPYSADSTSAYYKEYKAVYQTSRSLTLAQRQIAAWWADDPSNTVAPPGHSYNLATTVIQQVRPDLVKAAETYARVGMAVADAFINCWKCKYVYHRERPSTFIAANIDKGWAPFWPEPPFPAFSSGHSTQAAAMATVLTKLYGNRLAFTDSTHCGRPVDPVSGTPYDPRDFKNFWESAVECAESRLYGGIHTRNDNEVGLTEGKKIGTNVNALRWWQ